MAATAALSTKQERQWLTSWFVTTGYDWSKNLASEAKLTLLYSLFVRPEGPLVAQVNREPLVASNVSQKRYVMVISQVEDATDVITSPVTSVRAGGIDGIDVSLELEEIFQDDAGKLCPFGRCADERDGVGI